MHVVFTIEGEPASKANSRRVTASGGRRVIKSAKALAFERSALLQIPASARVMLTGPVFVSIRIYYASERPDLDESLILDCLQARYSKGGATGGGQLVRRGVILNDRQIREKHIYHFVDRARPRAEIMVGTLAEITAADLAP